MQSSRDPSVFRNLALSFGEGLVFSIGMKLTQSAIKTADAPVAAPGFAPLAARLEQIEQRIQKVERPREPVPQQQFDQKVIHAIVAALETRLQEHSGQVDRRLTDLESTLTASVQGAVAQRVVEESAAIRDQVVAMHRDFAAAVARIVGEQVAERAAALEPMIEQRMEAAVAPLQAEIADLKARIAETENTMAEFVSAITMMCRKAAERDEQPAAPQPRLEAAEPAVPAPAAASAPEEPLLDLPIPAFAQPRKPAGTWRIPIASSFLFAFATAGVLMMRVI